MKTTNRIIGLFSGSLSILVLFGAQASWAQLDVEVSTGYNDAGPGTSPYLPPPSPWVGSANTTVYGDQALTASDPDIDGILFQNLGATTVNLTAASIGSYDLFSLDGISGPVALAPGANVILTGVDGSDTFSSVQTVGLTIGGTSYSFTDATGPGFADGALQGNAQYWESVPWTPIYTPNISSSVPDSGSSLEMMTAAILGVFGLERKLRRQSVA